jgi:thiol-disulfide isomerase/thioredoxin
MKMRRTITLLIVVATIAALVWTIVQSSYSDGEGTVGRVRVGKLAPNFEVTTFDGQKVRLADYRGQVVLINFWASWCKPCVREMPIIDRIHQSQASDVEILFMNVGESKGTVSEFMNNLNFSFPVSIDVTGKVSSLYEITGLPATIIIDKSGIIRTAMLGEITNYTLLTSWLENALHPL